MVIKKVLFSTKFRELSYNSISQLLPLQDSGLKEIVLCHVIPREEVGFVPFGGYLKEEENRLREEAVIRFEDWQKSLNEKGIQSKIVIKVGEPVPQILHTAQDEKADLIVVGMGKHTKDLPLSASKTIEIVTRSIIPVLVSKYLVSYKVEDEIFDKENERIFERPMLICDWAEPSMRARDILLSFRSVIEEALIFHDMDVEQATKNYADGLDELKEVTIGKLDKLCEEIQQEGGACETHLGAGKIVSEIIRISRDRHASMIIMGTSGKGRLSEFIHGSVSHSIVRESELPTLLVP